MGAPKGNCFNPNGAPKKPIDWKVFEEACAIFCTQEEMEGLLGVDRDTIMSRVKEHYGKDYSAVYKRFSANGKQSLRRQQFKLAQKNTAMAIWLGKNYLDQKETFPENQVNENITKQYLEVIGQLASLQSARKIEESNKINDAKSA